MILKKLFLFIGVCLLLASCDPRYDIYYIIDNQSDNELTIIRVEQYINQSMGTTSTAPLDTSLIVANTKLLFDYDEGYGYTHLEVQEVESVAPHIILNQDSVRFKRDITNLEHWNLDCKRRKNCAGTFTLTVTNEDFQ